MTIKAIYSKGMLKPLEPLSLDENQAVELELTILSPMPTLTATLFGAFPQLSVLTPDDFVWAKRQLSRTLDKQSGFLDGLN